MPDFGAILKNIETGIINIGKNQLAQYVPQVTTDAKAIVTAISGDVQTWTQQLEEGKISTNDLKDLIVADESYLEIAALAQIGLAEAQLDQFKNSVVNLIVTTISGLI